MPDIDMPTIEVVEIEADPNDLKLRCHRCNSQDAFDIDTEFTARYRVGAQSIEPMDCIMTEGDMTTCLSCGVTGNLRDFID
jgi:hypothetical protein